MAHSIRTKHIHVSPKKSGRFSIAPGALLHTAASAVRTFVRQNTVLAIALAVAFVTSIVIPPDAEYLGYFDPKTLTCLFCTLACICALRNIRFFVTLARRIIMLCKNAKLCVLTLVYITFIGSMFLANDMALLTFLPLGFMVLQSAKQEKYMAFTFVMQNIAANLGGMLTPFGNPQNLYIHSYFDIPTGEFMSIMALPFVVSIAVITLCCLIFVKKEPLTIENDDVTINRPRALIYLVLFALSIVIVFETVPYWVGLVIVPLVLMFLDRDALKKVDYPLLLTFCAFFIFAGNMARIPMVKELFSWLLEKNTLLVSAFSCQFISNVPSAVLLSQFTDNYRELLLGVNIGGAGTLIASLASLITFREYTKHYPEKTGKYIALFSVCNFGMLALLLGVESLWLALMG
ncbi:MAG: citrate transporter [Clostridia bacterium]|nr:citrate transporter [Clostridia bacterium]